MFCNACGQQAPPDSAFCNRCGARLVKPDSDDSTSPVTTVRSAAGELGWLAGKAARSFIHAGPKAWLGVAILMLAIVWVIAFRTTNESAPLSDKSTSSSGASTASPDTSASRPSTPAEEQADTGSKTLETPLRDIGKKEPQTRKEQAERTCHQAKELEGLGQVISTDLKNSCELLGYW